MLLTLENTIGTHRTQDLADFKMRTKGVDIDEMKNSDENRNNFFSKEVSMRGLTNTVRNVIFP